MAGINGMSQRVKIKVRANEVVRFPNLCVYCARPALGWMGLKRRIGRITRRIEVPLCVDCRQQLSHMSAAEERLQKLGRLLAIVALLLTLALALLLTPAGMEMILRLLIGLLFGLLAAEIVIRLYRRARRKVASPVKLAVYDSAQIVDFSWRATTFEFSNELFLERFRALNEPHLMES